MMRNLNIEHRPSGEHFPWPCCTDTVDEGIALARLTFGPALWNITEATALRPPVETNGRPCYGQADLF